MGPLPKKDEGKDEVDDITVLCLGWMKDEGWRIKDEVRDEVDDITVLCLGTEWMDGSAWMEQRGGGCRLGSGQTDLRRVWPVKDKLD